MSVLIASALSSYLVRRNRDYIRFLERRNSDNEGASCRLANTRGFITFCRMQLSRR
jgi:hypothetical protein